MYKKIYFFLMYPISIYSGWYVYNWLVTNPLERYVIPIIIIWLPEIIGWHNFFIAVGVFVGMIIFGLLCMPLEAFEKNK